MYFAAHTNNPYIISNDCNGDLGITWNDKRASGVRAAVNQMIALLTYKDATKSLKNIDLRSPISGGDPGH